MEVNLASQTHHIPQVGLPHKEPVTIEIRPKRKPTGAKLFAISERILILKGPNTIIANGKGEKYIISTANSLLATAGTGDVLSGIIMGYLSNGYNLLNASILGVYVHSRCSILLYNKGNDNIIASDLIKEIPKVQYILRGQINESL